MVTKRVALGVCIFAICGTLFAQPSREIETVVRRLYERYAAGDMEGAMALWANAAPERSAFHNRIAGVLRVHCVEVRDVDVTHVEIDGNHAVAGVTVGLAKWRPRAGAWRPETELATLTLERNGAGAWLLTGWKRQEEALADALMAAKSADERRCLLASRRWLVTPVLDQILAVRALGLINQERHADAAQIARLIENIAAGLGDIAGLSAARGLDSIILRRQKRWDLNESLRAARESVALAEASGDSETLARSLLRLGRTERFTRVDDFGRPSFARAVELLDDVEDGSAVAMAAGGLAEYADDFGDHHAALRYAMLSRDLAASSGDQVSLLNAELHIAGAYQFYGDCMLALPHLERAVSLARSTNVTGSTPAEALYDSAHCHLMLGDEAAFLRAIKEGAAQSGETADEVTAVARSWMTDYYLDHDDVRRASETAEDAVRMAATGFRSGILDRARVILAGVRLRQHRPSDALAIMSLNSELSYPHYFAARAYRMLGRRDEAYCELWSTTDKVDIQMNELMADERQMQLRFESSIDAFVELTDMLVEDKRYSDALTVAERAKGRVLLDALRGGSRLARSMMNDGEREAERAIQERITTLNAQHKNDPASAAALTRTRVELEEYRAVLYSKYPRLKAQEPNVPLVTRGELAELLRGRSSAFLEYMVGEERTHVFLVRRSGSGVSVRCRTIVVPKKALNRKVNGFVSAVAARDRLYSAPGRELYQLLVAPFENELRGVTTLCIIPDGPLWQMPFESLVQPDGRFLIERTAVFYAPSITTYREMIRRDRAVHAPGAFLAFADPPVSAPHGSVSEMKLRDTEYAPLPDAAREVESIATLFRAEPTKIYVGADALESRAKAESPRYAVIHFATHGVLDDHDPMFSHLVLAPRPGDPSEDGLLETWEMMQLDLHANLAVLSACDTARGTVHAGEGLIGMSWALSVAGTSSTIVTQWKIASSTAADLMVDFYREWLRARPSMPFAKAEALRRARLHVLSDPAHRHPFYWSAFVLIGSGS